MKFKIKLSIALAMSLLLVACGGGGSKPVKMVKVWKIVEEVKTRTLNGEVVSIITNTYDKNGFLIRLDYDEDHLGVSYILYDYSDGALSKKTFYRASGSKESEIVIDKQGRDIESLSFDADGEVIYTALLVNTYDNKKRIVKEESWTNNTPYRVVFFTYEGDIETHKYDLDLDGQADDLMHVLTRNDRGELIKDERYNNNQELVSTKNYTYEYDENDNIITKTFSYPTNPTGEVLITYTWEERSVPESYAK